MESTKLKILEAKMFVNHLTLNASNNSTLAELAYSNLTEINSHLEKALEIILKMEEPLWKELP